MAIEKSGVSNQTSTLSKKLETLGVRTNNLNDYLNKEKPAEKSDGFTLSSSPSEGMFNLEPVERYQYILSQAQKQARLDTDIKKPEQAQQQVKLDTNIKNPEQTIKQANEIINNAIMPPSFDNPDRAYLTRAIQIKRLAESRLDIAA